MTEDTGLRRELLMRIASIAEQRLEPDEVTQFRQFLEQVVQVHPEESLFQQSDDSNFGAFYGLYRFGLERSPNEHKVRVFNPRRATEGWESQHTLIYFCLRDAPFLVDSIRMALNRLRIDIHLLQSNPVSLTRDSEGGAVNLAPGDDSLMVREDFGMIFVGLLPDRPARRALEQELVRVLDHVRVVVEDFQPMLTRLDAEIQALKSAGQPPDIDRGEEIAFLEWLRDGNFTFLGISEFDLRKHQGRWISTEQSDERLGVMRLRAPLQPAPLQDLSPGFSQFHESEQNLAFTKSVQRSIVHRDAYSDYVIIKRRDKRGRSVGEMRLLGLYTSRLYHLSIEQIPLVRRKCQWILAHSQLDGASHNGKTLVSIMQGHPRDELIQASQRELLKNLLSIWKIYERRTVRLFIRSDPFEKFASCIIYLPRESLRTTLRERIEARLAQALNAKESEFTTQFLAESVLARIHIVFHITDSGYRNLDIGQLEAEIADIVKDWTSHLADKVKTRWGDRKGQRLLQRFKSAFPVSYQEQIDPQSAVDDLAHILQLKDASDLAIHFFKESGDEHQIMRLKLFRRDANLELSDLIPMLENLGFRVLVENPYRIQAADCLIWIHDFRLRFVLELKTPLDVEAVRQHFKAALLAIWRDETESDGFNRLVLGARLDWRSVLLLRAYARYMKQIGVLAGQDFIAEVLSRHLDITRNLIALFRVYFDPRLRAASDDQPGGRSESKRNERAQRLKDKVLDALDAVDSLNEDQVIRGYLDLINATRRTNFFQRDAEGQPKIHLSVKIATRELEVAPEPRPLHEIFVYSPRMEGVHLRNGKVARGGIRWSDRLEDYRTEVLGLVKAQHVKNAVIVPVGAKGGFICKRPPADRESWLEEGRACYRTLIRGMLDLTDQVGADGSRCPPQVICRDDPDPYLVVAADKGTASFSDIANEISAEYNHWLGDAFASGGSHGYDHKQMGITARGGWVAVQRHFRELGLNVDVDEFSVLGIGDMAGDVFGNAMLLSKKIRLVAAFNHQHIFIDPSPDVESAWRERKRLFEKSGSSWADYNRSLISVGGGVFSRTAKSIPLSNQMRDFLGIKTQAEALPPMRMINLLLQAQVDLIWNGGIGTYVKASNESNAQVGDRANDALRVDGKQLRCRVFGEGGNLGMTQLGRIEYCQRGGICNTDFIDNSAGVDCSDHEVNIKILLNDLMAGGSMNMDQRNALLVEMQDEVAEMVLRNNYDQTLAISLAHYGRVKNQHDYVRFLDYLEAEAHLKRNLEMLPDEETLKERAAKSQHWTRPELSILMSYAKVVLKQQLAEAAVGNENWVDDYLYAAFPRRLVDSCPEWIQRHQLKNEIVATQLANQMVDRMGFTFCYRLQESVGASVVEVARVFTLSMKLLRLDELWSAIEQLDYQIKAETQHRLWQQVMQLGLRSARWYLRNRRLQDPRSVIEQMQPGFAEAEKLLDQCLPEGWSQVVEQQANDYREAGVSPELANQIAMLDARFLVPGIVDLALSLESEVEKVARLRFQLSESLSTHWLMALLVDWAPGNRWQDFAREAHVDDLESMMRRLSYALLKGSENLSTEQILERWNESESHLIGRFRDLIGSLQSAANDDLSVFTVVLRELKGLVDATFSRFQQGG